MNIAYKRFLPFALGAVMILTLTGLLAKYRYEIQRQQDAARVVALLEPLGRALSGQLGAGTNALHAIMLPTADPPAARRPALPPKWQFWRYTEGDSQYSTLDGSQPLIALPELRHDLAAADRAAASGQADAAGAAAAGNHPPGGPLLLGPYATALNLEALTLAIASRAKDGRTQWWGSTLPTNELIPGAALIEFMRQGLRLQLVDTGSGTALFQSDPGELQSWVHEDVPSVATNLQLRAAPRDGWAVPLRQSVPSLLLALAVCVWLSIELRRGRVLRDAATDLAEAEARRQQANLLYGQAIDSVSTLESRLQMVSLFDTGTGLANRSSLLHRIGTGLEAMRNTQTGTLAVLAIGLDQLQHIGNSFGAEFASRVLVVAAERVEKALPFKDMLYRSGDAQLAVVFPNLDSTDLLAIADKFISEIEAPISLDSHTFLLRPSVGIAETASGYQFVDSLLDQANTALSAAQHATPARRCVFDSSTARDSVSRLQLEVDLVRAFDERQFTLEFEPIMTPGNNAVAGFEALIRWDHPTEGRIAPSTFMSIAAQSGIAARLDRWVMRHAAQQAKAWRRAGHELFISFNLSAEVFQTPDIEEFVGDVLAEFELPGKYLAIELTEAALIQDVRGAVRTLARLNELGVYSWLDDFGIGYSSMGHLRELPLKGVKIDRSFVNRTVTDARDFGFLKSMIDLVSYLGMESIAEGVVSREQLELLGMTTCDYYQGTYFAESMSAAAAELWLDNKRAKAPAEEPV